MISQEKIKAARDAGYSSSQIADYLGAQGYSDKINLARESGYSDDDIIGHLEKSNISNSQNVQPISRTEALARAGSQGATLGFADELVAGAKKVGNVGARAIEKVIYGDNIIPEISYKDERDLQRKKLDQAENQYPVQSFLTEIGSGIATGATVLKGAGLIKSGFKSAVKGGALLSAIQSAGETKNINNLSQSAKDIAVSTILGGATGGVSERLINKAAPAIYKGGKTLLTKSNADNILEKVVKPEDAAKYVRKLENAQTEGRISNLPDIGGEEVSALTRVLGKTDGGKKLINNVINSRAYQSSSRVTNLIDKKISGGAYYTNLDDIIEARKELAGPLYKKAYQEANVALNQQIATPDSTTRLAKINELISDERIKGAINTARKDYGIGSEIPDIAIETLHGARQVVDDIIGVAKRQGESNKARSYRNLKDQINNVVYDVAPTMREADKVFSGHSALKNAQEAGLDFNGYASADELKRLVSKYTSGEKDAFKIGVKENLLRTVNKTGDEISAARKVYGNSLNREKLKSVFDTREEYNDFSKKMFDEIRVFKTKQRVLGGSRTDINLADEGLVIDKVAKGLVSAKTFGVSNVLSAVSDSIKKRYYGLNEQNAQELARIITNPQKSIDSLRKVAAKASPNQANEINNFIRDITPSILGGEYGVIAAKQVTK